MKLSKIMATVLSIFCLAGVCSAFQPTYAITDAEVSRIIGEADELQGLPEGYRCKRISPLADAMSGIDKNDVDFELRLLEKRNTGKYRLEIGSGVRIITREDMQMCAEAVKRAGTACRISEVKVFGNKGMVKEGAFSMETLNPNGCSIPAISSLRRPFLSPMDYHESECDCERIRWYNEPTDIVFWGNVNGIDKGAFDGLKNARIEFLGAIYYMYERAFMNLENVSMVFQHCIGDFIRENFGCGCFEWRNRGLSLFNKVIIRPKGSVYGIESCFIG